MTNPAGEPTTAVHWSVRSLKDLRRCPEQSVLSGVCAGIARQSGYDVLLIRTLFILLATAAAVGVAIYLLLSITTPAGSSDTAPLDRYLPSWRSLDETGRFAALIAFSALFALVSGIFNPLSIGTLVILVGAVGLGIATRAQAENQLRYLPPPVLEEMSELLPNHPDFLAASPSSDTSRVITRRWLKRLLGTAVTLILATATWLTVGTLLNHEDILLVSHSAALLVIGMGMISTARYGRSVSLLVAGFCLTVLIIFSSVNKVGVFEGVDAPEYRYTSASAVPSNWDYRNDTSALRFSDESLNSDVQPEIRAQNSVVVLDLREVSLDRDQEIIISAQSSAVQVILPTDVGLVIVGDTRLSMVRVNNERLPLWSRTTEWRQPGSVGQAQLTIEIDSRISLIEVVT